MTNFENELIFDERGFDQFGINKYTKTLYDLDGYDKNYFNKHGINYFTKTRFDENGLDCHGFDKNSKHNVTGGFYNPDEFDAYGSHLITRTKFDQYGIDIDRYDKDGFNIEGYNRDGLHFEGNKYYYYINGILNNTIDYCTLPDCYKSDEGIISAFIKKYKDKAFRSLDSYILNNPIFAFKYFLDYESYLKISDIWKSDKLLAFRVLNRYGSKYYDLLDDELKNDKDINNLLNNEDFNIDTKYEKEFLEDKLIIMNNIDKYNITFYSKLPVCMKNDLDIVTVFYNKFKSNIFRFFSKKVLNNKELALNYFYVSNAYYKYSDIWKFDKELALKVINLHSKYYFELDDSLKNDNDILHRVVYINCSIFSKLALEHRNNSDLCIAAINSIASNEYISPLKYASDEVKNNIEVCWVSIRKFPDTYAFSGDKIKNDKDISFYAINRCPRNIVHLGNSLKNDFEFLKLCFKNCPQTIKYMNKEFISDKKYVKDLINEIGIEIFPYISTSLNCNVEFINEVINGNDYRVVKYLDKSLLIKKSIIKNAIASITNELLSNDCNDDKSYQERIILNIFIDLFSDIYDTIMSKNNYNFILNCINEEIDLYKSSQMKIEG